MCPTDNIIIRLEPTINGEIIGNTFYRDGVCLISKYVGKQTIQGDFHIGKP